MILRKEASNKADSILDNGIRRSLSIFALFLSFARMREGVSGSFI
jgi:hypothetical protein